jgi:hypothetical protein
VNKLSYFHLGLFKGNVFKELITALFEESHYTVIPYGYENPYSNIKKRLAKESSATALRIRSSPDLLIYDDETGDVKLVEVKMSSYETPRIPRIDQYKKCWEDAIIVLIVPFGNVFYAQKIENLGIKGYYHLASDFYPIQDIFPKVDSEALSEYKKIALKMIEAFHQDKENIEQ